MKTIRESSLNDINDFPKVVDPLREFIIKNWDISAKPKGYDEYLESEQEESDIPEFNGLLNTSAGALTFPCQLSLENIAYSDKEQGRGPVEELIGALVSYGMAIGERRAHLNLIDDVFLSIVKDLINDVDRGAPTELQKSSSEFLKRIMKSRYNYDF